MKPKSSLNAPLKANNKYIIPNKTNKSDNIFETPIRKVGNKTTLQLSDRFHSRDDPLTYVNWSRRTYDVGPNSYKSNIINTIEYEMNKNRTKSIFGDKSKP